MNRDSSVSIVTGLRPGDREIGLDCRKEYEMIFLYERHRPNKPAVERARRVVFLWVNQPGRPSNR